MEPRLKSCLQILVACSAVWHGPLALGLDSPTTREASITSSSQAHALAIKVVEAYGGSDKLKNLNELTYQAKGHIKEYSMISGAINTFDCEILSKGDKTRTELNVMGQEVVTGYNGSISWIKQGENVYPADQTTTKRVQSEVEHGLKLLDDLAKKSNSITVGKSKTVGGKECPCLIIRVSDGLPTSFYIDPDTHLVARSEYMGVDLEMGLKTLKGYVYSDYRPVFGTLLPFRTVEYNDEKISAETDLSNVELIAASDDSAFEMPQEKEIARLKEGPVKIPFDYRVNEVIVKARVNGNIDAYFIVDTGATMSVINQSEGTKFGATQESDYRMTTGSGSIKAGFTKLKSIAFGDLVLHNVAVVITKLPGFTEVPGNKPAGIIGADILRQFLVTVDYETNTLILSDPHSVKIPSDAIVVDTQPALGVAGLIVEGKLDGQPLTFLVDTGAAFNNVSEGLVKTLLKSPVLPVGKVEGLDGNQISAGSVMFKNLKIGPLSVARPVFSVAPQVVGGAPSGIIVNGALAILGNPFWSRFKLTVDYRNQKLFLQRSKESEQMDEAKEEIERIQLKYWRSQDSAAASSQFRELAKRYQQKSWLAASSICLAKAAYFASEQLKKKPNWNTGLAEIMAEFHKAEELAGNSKSKEALAEVLATTAVFDLKFTTPANIKEAKPLLTRALAAAPNNMSVSMGCYWLAKEQENNRGAHQLLNQILMQDPSNWEALWERYKNAKNQDNRSDMALVANQLKRYYSGVPEVEALHTESGG